MSEKSSADPSANSTYHGSSSTAKGATYRSSATCADPAPFSVSLSLFQVEQPGSADRISVNVKSLIISFINSVCCRTPKHLALEGFWLLEQRD